MIGIDRPQMCLQPCGVALGASPEQMLRVMQHTNARVLECNFCLQLFML